MNKLTSAYSKAFLHKTNDRWRAQEGVRVMRDRLHGWEPDILMVIGDDQAENFLQGNLPLFCLYTSVEVDGHPF